MVLIRSSLCSPQPSIHLRPWLLGWKGDSSKKIFQICPLLHKIPVGTKLFAAVRRGDCRFSQKAENAANAGFAGLVILDDQTDTDTSRISGNHSEDLASFPVIFLLKTEARILEKHLMESSSLSMAIQVQKQRKVVDNMAFLFVCLYCFYLFIALKHKNKVYNIKLEQTSF